MKVLSMILVCCFFAFGCEDTMDDNDSAGYIEGTPEESCEEAYVGRLEDIDRSQCSQEVQDLTVSRICLDERCSGEDSSVWHLVFEASWSKDPCESLENAVSMLEYCLEVVDQ